MSLLTALLVKLLLGVFLIVLALWCVVALETVRTLRLLRQVRALRKRSRRLLAALRQVRAQRDHWRREAARWERAYHAAVAHDHEDPHPTLQQTAVLTLVRPEGD